MTGIIEFDIPAYSLPDPPDLIDGRPFRVVHTADDGPVTVVAEGERWNWSFDLGWMDPVPSGESITVTRVVRFS